MHLKIHPEQVNGLSRILAEGKETTALLVMKFIFFSRKDLFSLSIHIQSKWTFQVRNVGLGSGFRKER